VVAALHRGPVLFLIGVAHALILALLLLFLL
jgi:hypothetical protein